MVRYEYDAWGNHVVLDTEGQEITAPEHVGNINPYRYRGYFYDVETGLYYLQTRYYDPSIGRFISQDGVEYADPETVNGLNLYAYCNNNPVMGYDPNGTIDWKKLFGWIVTIYAVTVAVVVGVAATILSCGATSPLLGLGLAALGGALLGFAGAVTSNIATQVQTVGWNNVNLGQSWVAGAIGAVAGAISGVISFGIGQIASGVGEFIGYSLSKMFVGGLEVSKVFSTALMTGVFGFVGNVSGSIIGSIIGDYFGHKVSNQTYDINSLKDSFFGVFSGWIMDFISGILGINF